MRNLRPNQFSRNSLSTADRARVDTKNWYTSAYPKYKPNRVKTRYRNYRLFETVVRRVGFLGKAFQGLSSQGNINAENQPLPRVRVIGCLCKNLIVCFNFTPRCTYTCIVIMFSVNSIRIFPVLICYDVKQCHTASPYLRHIKRGE